MVLFDALDAFFQEHQYCGELDSGVDELLTLFTFLRRNGRRCAPRTRLSGFTKSFAGACNQGSLPSEGAALTLLFGLVVSGQIKLRRIDG